MRGTRIEWVTATALCLVAAIATSQPPHQPPYRHARAPALDTEALAKQNFGADAPWFLHKIPFLEIDDPDIQQIYYYRWKLFRSHVREIGPQGTTVTEFLDDVPWARHPFTDLNDSTSFHILEGRWLRSPTLVDSLIDHEYSGAGNDRHFSESIAAATEASTRVTGDPAPGLRHLDTMQYIYNAWDDHFDRTRNLYWIEPLLDATEYTISSTDASGAGFTDTPSTDQNRNGFTGGFAYRPSINSYQYANALAIARFATLASQPGVAADYTERAAKLRSAVLDQLWNPALSHFTDRYQRSTKFVKAGDFIRGRELVGYTPWLYDLPPQAAPVAYNTAWSHLLAPAELVGPYGLRTVEPSYPKYMAQYRYDQPTGQAECQWNGPSWPFQTSQTLTAMANLIDDYPPAGVTPADYLRLLRQYTRQHFLTPGHPDLQEDYNPDTGKPIVGLPRSHHYNHSTYIDLILSGLLGIRPRADNILEITPLLPTNAPESEHPIRFFALEGLAYHGHDISLIYDADGTRYHVGPGLSVYIDGTRAAGPMPLGRIKINLPAKSVPARVSPGAIDLAVNVGVPDGPAATASSSISPAATAQAIDGRLWFFPEIANGWSPAPSDAGPISWYALDLKQPRTLASLELYFFAEAQTSLAPAAYRVQYRRAAVSRDIPVPRDITVSHDISVPRDIAEWIDIPAQTQTPRQPIAGGENRITFPPITTQELRVVFTNPPAPANFRLVELKAFAP